MVEERVNVAVVSAFVRVAEDPGALVKVGRPHLALSILAVAKVMRRLWPLWVDERRKDFVDIPFGWWDRSQNGLAYSNVQDNRKSQCSSHRAIRDAHMYAAGSTAIHMRATRSDPMQLVGHVTICHSPQSTTRAPHVKSGLVLHGCFTRVNVRLAYGKTARIGDESSAGV